MYTSQQHGVGNLMPGYMWIHWVQSPFCRWCVIEQEGSTSEHKHTISVYPQVVVVLAAC